jgi:co-chaperonin GroES (HSP10)
MNIAPLRNMILVKLEDAPEPARASGIVVARLEREPSCHAVVLAIGPDVRETRVGAHVVVSRLQGIEIAGQVMLQESAVLAYLEDA